MFVSLSRYAQAVWLTLAALALWLGLTTAAQAAEPAVLPAAALPPLTNPTCASWGPDRVDCFLIGADGRLYHSYADLASSGDYRDFSPWIQEPSTPADGFDPGAGIALTAWGPGRLDLMAITREGDVVHTYYDQNAWQLPNWEFISYPGNAGANEIGCGSWGPNRIDCFVRGKNHRVYQVRWDGTGWGTFDMGPLPTGTASDSPRMGIAAAGRDSNTLFQVVVAVDGNVYHRRWNGAAWSGWINGGKPGADGLMTVTCQAGVIYVMDCVFQDVAGIPWHRSWYDGENRWLDWHRLTGLKTYYAAGQGFTKVIGDSGAFYVLTYGESGRIYLGYGRGGAATFDWYGWDALSGPRDQRVYLPFTRR
jgi:sialidase-1